MTVLTLKIVNYDRTNSTIVNYNLKTLIVQATGLSNKPTRVDLTRPRSSLANTILSYNFRGETL
jgi:hypothetical protein